MTEALSTLQPAEPPEPAQGQGTAEQPRSLSGDAWRSLRRRPLFWVAALMIFVFLVMAAFPGLFTSVSPGKTFDVRLRPGGDHIFGTDSQGYDIYSRTIHGARASIIVGILTTLLTGVVGAFIGVLSAYFGGFVDTVLSRIADVFFAIPVILGGILFMTTFRNTQDTPYLVVILKVVIAMSILGWPSVSRLMRAAVLQVKPSEYVLAARALGASTSRIIWSHIIPNALGPVIAFSTISLGVYIVAESTLSFLGIGLVPPAISWGVAIGDAIDYVRVFPHMLFFPSLALSLCVLSFIMLGDAVSDAFDPKSATR